MQRLWLGQGNSFAKTVPSGAYSVLNGSTERKMHDTRCMMRS